ncbi:MAG: glycosyltransferase 87 family protein [Patescibacteria group bacterium]|nr:glycosyltransferase 87 family protein [Patescibacteria group bacterium]
MNRFLTTDKTCIFFVFIISFVIRIPFLFFSNSHPDIFTFSEWSLSLIRHKWSYFYDIENSDYLPGYLYALWFIGKLYYFINTKLFYIDLEFVYKLPSFFTDIANSVLIYLISSKLVDRAKAFMVSAFYAFYPGFLMNSVIWGQVDSIVAFFLISAIYLFLCKKYLLSGIFLGLGQSIKPVIILILPFFAYYLLRRYGFNKVFVFLLTFALMFLLTFVPFAKGNFIDFVIERNLYTANFWQYTTLNMFNFWLVITNVFHGGFNYVSDKEQIWGMTYHNIGLLLFIFVYSFAFIRYILLFKNNIGIFDAHRMLIFYGSIIFLALPMFMTRMHERHPYYGFVLLLLATPFIKGLKRFSVYILFLIYFVNLIYSYKFASYANNSWVNMMVFALSILNIINYFLVFKFLIRFNK